MSLTLLHNTFNGGSYAQHHSAEYMDVTTLPTCRKIVPSRLKILQEHSSELCRKKEPTLAGHSARVLGVMVFEHNTPVASEDPKLFSKQDYFVPKFAYMVSFVFFRHNLYV